MAIYGYTKNYKLIKPKYDTDTWHDYEYDNLDTIDAVLSAIYASGNWQGFWATNTAYVVGDVVIDRDTDTMYKVMVDHTTSAATFAAEQTAHPDYYELWSPNNLAESWASKMDGKVSNEDYSAKAYAISSGLIDDGSAKEWAIGSGAIGNTNEYSAKKYATDAHNDYISMTTNANVSTVASNINNVNTVGQSISNVNTVANNISDVNTAALNIEAIKDAPNQANAASQSASDASQSATNAANSATASSNSATDSASSATASANSANASAASENNSHIWAEGTDAQVAALGGVHSSKGWAEQSTSVNISLTNSPYTTNRILEIPQDIKLELNDGTLTLKAGSKVYVPNGFEADGTTQKFDVVTIDSDKTRNDKSSITNAPLFYIQEENRIVPYIGFSGSTAPTFIGQGIWYDTTNNVCKRSTNGGSTWDTVHASLPCALVTNDGSGYISIDQIFNGFGYIGSTVFALPGVKVQTPNGRKADGTYNSSVYTTSTVLTMPIDAGWGTFDIYLTTTRLGKWPDVINGSVGTRYNSENNYYEVYDAVQSKWFPLPMQLAIVKVKADTTSPYKITSFEPFTVDSVVNSNASNFSQAGRSYLSGLGMPSSRYIDLTLAASEIPYTAPANGWFTINKAGTAGQIFAFENVSAGGVTYNTTLSVATDCRLSCPAKKGDNVVAFYNATGVTRFFRFVYAEGENNV